MLQKHAEIDFQDGSRISFFFRRPPLCPFLATWLLHGPFVCLFVCINCGSRQSKVNTPIFYTVFSFFFFFFSLFSALTKESSCSAAAPLLQLPLFSNSKQSLQTLTHTRSNHQAINQQRQWLKVQWASPVPDRDRPQTAPVAPDEMFDPCS